MGWRRGPHQAYDAVGGLDRVTALHPRVSGTVSPPPVEDSKEEDLVNRLFPEPEEEPRGRWANFGAGSVWFPEKEEEQ